MSCAHGSRLYERGYEFTRLQNKELHFVSKSFDLFYEQVITIKSLLKPLNTHVPGRAKMSFRVPSKSKVANVVGRLKRQERGCNL